MILLSWGLGWVLQYSMSNCQEITTNVTLFHFISRPVSGPASNCPPFHSHSLTESLSEIECYSNPFRESTYEFRSNGRPWLQCAGEWVVNALIAELGLGQNAVTVSIWWAWINFLSGIWECRLLDSSWITTWSRQEHHFSILYDWSTSWEV